jgi:hypothetical protein
MNEAFGKGSSLRRPSSNPTLLAWHFKCWICPFKERHLSISRRPTSYRSASLIYWSSSSFYNSEFPLGPRADLILQNTECRSSKSYFSQTLFRLSTRLPTLFLAGTGSRRCPGPIQKWREWPKCVKSRTMLKSLQEAESSQLTPISLRSFILYP